MALSLTGLALRAIAFVAQIGAEERSGEIVFKDTQNSGHVVFSHDKHFWAGNACNDCHTAVFEQKAGTADENNALTMKSIREGKFRGACHNGKKAFAAEDNCRRCHTASK